MPGSWLLDKFGLKKVYAFGIFFWSLFTLLVFALLVVAAGRSDLGDAGRAAPVCRSRPLTLPFGLVWANRCPRQSRRLCGRTQRRGSGRPGLNRVEASSQVSPSIVGPARWSCAARRTACASRDFAHARLLGPVQCSGRSHRRGAALLATQGASIGKRMKPRSIQVPFAGAPGRAASAPLNPKLSNSASMQPFTARSALLCTIGFVVAAGALYTTPTVIHLMLSLVAQPAACDRLPHAGRRAADVHVRTEPLPAVHCRPQR